MRMKLDNVCEALSSGLGKHSVNVSVVGTWCLIWSYLFKLLWSSKENKSFELGFNTYSRGYYLCYLKQIVPLFLSSPYNRNNKSYHEDKEKSLKLSKTARPIAIIRQIACNGPKIILAIAGNEKERKKCFQYSEGNRFFTRILYSAKLSNKCEGKIKTFQECKL